jgi:cytochrome c biogenesis protein CcmG/thiol:disulfide interchange protein DsbE
MSVEPPSEPAADGGGGRRRLIGVGLGVLVAAGVLALLFVGIANKNRIGNNIDEALAEGRRPPAPDIALPVLQTGPGLPPVGETLSLADLRGRVVVLNVWASWCPPCRDEAPILEDVWTEYRARGVLVLGLNTEDVRDDALDFLRRYRQSFPSLRDGSDESRIRFEATAPPETYIIDREGRIALTRRGQVVDARQITEPLEQVL